MIDLIYIMINIDVDFLLNLDVFLIFNYFLQSWADKSGSGSDKNHCYEDEPEIWSMYYQCLWNSDSLNTKKIEVTLNVHTNKITLKYKRQIWLTSAESQVMLYWKHGAKLEGCKQDKMAD